MTQIKTLAEFDAYASNPRRLIVITDAANGTHVHKVSCRHVKREFFEEKVETNAERNGEYFAVATVREAFDAFHGLLGCSDRKCMTEWDVKYLQESFA